MTPRSSRRWSRRCSCMQWSTSHTHAYGTSLSPVAFCWPVATHLRLGWIARHWMSLLWPKKKRWQGTCGGAGRGGGGGEDYVHVNVMVKVIFSKCHVT